MKCSLFKERTTKYVKPEIIVTPLRMKDAKHFSCPLNANFITDFGKCPTNTTWTTTGGLSKKGKIIPERKK